jgi:hypothetical protein
MRYVSWKQQAGTSGVLTTQYVACFNITDPDATGVGHQPLGYDQWAEFYNLYLALKSKLTVEFSLTASITSPVVVGINVTRTPSTTFTTFEEFIENGDGVHALLSPSIDGPVVRTLHLDASLKRLFNLRNPRDEQSKYGAAFGSAPSNGMYFCIWTMALDQATTAGVSMLYSIDYDVSVSEPKNLTQS